MDIILTLLEGESLLTKIMGVILLLLVGKNIIQLPGWIKGRTTHDGCSLHQHMLKSVENQARIIRIKHIDTLYEQMSMLEVIHEDITLKMRSIYNDLASDQKDKEHYSLLVKSLEKDVKGLMRKWFKENHFTDRTELEFKAYVDEKVEHILQRVAFGLDEKYRGRGFKLSRESLQEDNEAQLVPFAAQKFRDAFYKARDISKDKEILVKNILDEEEL